MKSIDNDREISLCSSDPFSTETALYRKEHCPGDIVAMVAVPDPYPVALPNLGHQIVERQINLLDGFFAYRCYLNGNFVLLRESGYPPDVVLISMSYEGSYIRALRVLDQLGIPALRRDRSPGDPVVVFGGRAVSMNPLPLFDLADVIGIGDSDRLIPVLCLAYQAAGGHRGKMEAALTEQEGFILPARYRVSTPGGYLERWEPRNAPVDIVPARGTVFPHSWYLSPETDYNDIGYYEWKTFFSIEIVKACASKCLFCAAGFNDGPVRHTADVNGILDLARWAAGAGADLVKLFFPANSSVETTKRILQALLEVGLAPRVGSAKAERIDAEYIALVGRSGQEKFAVAPETGDVGLRARLGKPGMTEEVLQWVVSQVIRSGIPNLDFYLIMNLPGEADDSFDQTVDFVGRFARLAAADGLRDRFRVSIPNFFPKAWTPFQYAPSGGITRYLERVAALERACGDEVAISSMKASVDLLSQNIMSRGGVEVGSLLAEVYRGLCAQETATGAFRADTIEDWRTALAALRLREETYFAERDPGRPMPWHHVRMYDSLAKLEKAWAVFRRKSAAAAAGIEAAAG
jgi:radical SAM superfamily enzyme YgiQ (UPF0313 family)